MFRYMPDLISKQNGLTCRERYWSEKKHSTLRDLGAVSIISWMIVMVKGRRNNTSSSFFLHRFHLIISQECCQHIAQLYLGCAVQAIEHVLNLK